MSPTAALANPPGPRLPMLGALIMPGRDPLKLFSTLAQRYGDIVYFTLGSERVYLLNHPDLVRDVLVTNQRHFLKGRGLERAKKLLGEGLLTSEGAVHLRHRRMLQPSFHRQRIAGYAEVMVDSAARMADRWRDGDTIDVAKEMMRVTLSIVGKTLFDTDVESQSDEVGKAVTEVLHSFWYTLLPMSELIEKLPVPALRKAHAARLRLDHLIYSMIAERRASGIDRGDLLSMMLAAQDEDDVPDASRSVGLSDAQVRDEAMTLLLAGHETTANALTWTWYLLSQHPDVEKRLHAELDEVLGDAPPSMRTLPQLPYVERIVTESMRLYPPAWMLGRRATQEYQIGEYVAPPRSLLVMSQYVLHRDVRFYDEPQRFHPDRWTPELKATLPKFAYFPFGGGARQCIGEQFAWMELMLVLAATAQRWRLRLVPNHPVVPQPLITLRAKHGMRMSAHARS